MDQRNRGQDAPTHGQGVTAPGPTYEQCWMAHAAIVLEKLLPTLPEGHLRDRAAYLLSQYRGIEVVPGVGLEPTRSGF
jgi:hypothetical protein